MAKEKENKIKGR